MTSPKERVFLQAHTLRVCPSSCLYLPAFPAFPTMSWTGSFRAATPTAPQLESQVEKKHTGEPSLSLYGTVWWQHDPAAQ